MPDHRVVLVTGGAGFIGSNLLRYWSEAHPEDRLVCLDDFSYAGRPENLADLVASGAVELLEGDVTDTAFVESVVSRRRPRLVFHLAAQTHVDRSILSGLAFVRTNTYGTAVLVETLRHVWGTGEGLLVHVSTDEVYGPAGQRAWNESDRYRPTSPYAASKAGADHVVDAAFRTWGLPVMVVHPTNNYGPRQYPEKLIPLVIRNVLQDVSIPIYGRGDQERDWLFVEDTCRALDLLAHRGSVGEHYNVGTGQLTRNLALVEKLCDLLDDRLGRAPGTARRLITHVQDRPAHDVRYRIDWEKIAGLGWQPETMLHDGLARTVDWYLSHRDWLDRATGEDFHTYYERVYGTRPPAR